jgi:hypothetical protein
MQNIQMQIILYLYFVCLELENVCYVTFIEQKGECIIRYFGGSCDEFAEQAWPIKKYICKINEKTNSSRVKFDLVCVYHFLTIPKIIGNQSVNIKELLLNVL